MLFIFVPVFSFSCMSRPSKNSMMKRHTLSPKYLAYLDYAVYMIKASFLKIFTSCVLMYAVRIFYFRQAFEDFRRKHPDQFAEIFHRSSTDSNDFLHCFQYFLWGKYESLTENYSYWRLTFEQEHKFNFSFLLVILCYLAIGFESPNYTLFYKFTKNRIFRRVLILQFFLIITYYLLSTMVFLGPQVSVKSVKDSWDYYYPTYQVWLCALGVLVLLSVIEETTKSKVRHLYERDHNRLTIFFNTKLGMWSPR